MKSVVYTEPGPSSVLSVVEREIPQPGPGEVRVRLVRSGVNPTDWRFRVRPLAYAEVVPGQDGAGYVDALGPGVEGFAVGDRVWLMLAQHQRAYGTAAQYTVQPSTRVAHLPEGASFDLGAALGVPAMTAHRALTVGDPGPDRLGPGTMDGLTVLVQGGAGAVGNAAVQLARWSGATVVATVSSPEKAALASAAGAHHVVNYREGDTEAAIRAVAPEGIDLVVEVAPAQNNAVDLAVLKVGGTVSIYAKHGGEEFVVPIFETYFKNLRYQYLVLYFLRDEAIARGSADVTAAVAAGALRVGEEAGVPLHHFPLAETGAAHDAVERGAIGKVLIDVSDQ
ncbi:NADPH:quinone reductase [Amycolatopsis pigmentata]|uniref:NADPH:quinone reductase n=1 Tax=Amycolatopsis pigmentata TaxID=450801 RepID=A0ABW5FIQ7_9PSEU